jgi:lambda repressor-like predicted transcriptional regulator
MVLTRQLSVDFDRLSSLQDRTFRILQATSPIDPPIPEPRRCRKKQRRFTTDEAKFVADQYLAGTNMNQLAAAYEVHRTTVAKCLNKQQVPLRRFGFPSASIGEAAMLYRSGWSLIRLGEKFACSDSTVRTALIRHGVKTRPRNGCG